MKNKYTMMVIALLLAAGVHVSFGQNGTVPIDWPFSCDDNGAVIPLDDIVALSGYQRCATDFSPSDAKVLGVLQFSGLPGIGPFLGTAQIPVGGTTVQYIYDAEDCCEFPGDSFAYIIGCVDGSGSVIQGSVSTGIVNLVFVNEPPVAEPDTYSVDEDDVLVVGIEEGILANDSDSCHDFCAVIVAPPAVGTLELDLCTGAFTYTPPANYCGIVTFTYYVQEVDDATQTSETVTVTITVNAVNDAPVAVDDNYNAISGSTLVVAAPGVLANDSDVDALNDCGLFDLTAALVSGPSNGSLTLNADGSFEYTPVDGFCDVDSFTYVANDGELDSNIATVYLNVIVEEANQCPIKTELEDIDLCVDQGVNELTRDITKEELVYDRFVDPDFENAECTGNETSLVWEVSTTVGETPEPGFITVQIPPGSTDMRVILSNLENTFVLDECLKCECQQLYYNDPFLGNVPLQFAYYVSDGSDECLQNVGQGGEQRRWITISRKLLDNPPEAPTIEVATLEDTPITIPDVDILLPAYYANPDNCCENFSLQLVGCCEQIVPDCEGGYYEDLIVDLWPIGEFTVEHGEMTLTFNNDNATEITTAMGGIATLDGSQLRYTPPADWPLFGCEVDYIPYVIRDTAEYDEDCQSPVKTAIGIIEVTVCAVCDDPVAVGDLVETCEDETVSISLQDLVGNDYSVDFAPGFVVAYTGLDAIESVVYSNYFGIPADLNGHALIPQDESGYLASLVDGDLVSFLPGPYGVIDLNNSYQKITRSGFNWTQPTATVRLPGGIHTFDLPENVSAIFFAVEGFNFSGTEKVTAIANDGTEVSVTDFDARGIGFYAGEPGKTIVKIVIENDDITYAGDFALSFSPVAYVCNVGFDVAPQNGELIIDSYVSAVGAIATSLQYRPYANFYGEDTFSYQYCIIQWCCDYPEGQTGGNGIAQCSYVTNWVTGIVTVKVSAVSDIAPVANDDSFEGIEDTVLMIDPADLLANDTDGGDQSLNARNLAPEHLCIVDWDMVSANGGTVDLINGMIYYTPALNFYGTDSFTYTISDQYDGSCDEVSLCNEGNEVERYASATVYICVAPVNDRPELDVDGFYTPMNVPLEGDVSLNDYDVEVAAGQSGWKFYLHPNGETPDHAIEFVLNEDGTFFYHPATNYSGMDYFTYYVIDEGQESECGNSLPNISEPILVTIRVEWANICPVADSKTLTATEDTPRDITLTGVDQDGVIVGYVIGTPPANGTLLGDLDGSTATIVYEPALNYCGADSFTYAAVDNDGCVSAYRTVNITVQGVNDAPVAQNDFVVTDEDTPVTIYPADNDTDVDTGTSCGAAINRIAILDQPQHGSVVLSGWAVVYTPHANWNGTDQFTYQVFDSAGASDIGTVTIQVNPVCDAPVAHAGVVNAIEDTEYLGQVYATDVDSTDLIFATLAAPAKGTLTWLDAAIGTFSYVPHLNANGADSFTFVVTDECGLSGQAVVNITIAPVNDAPVAYDIATNTLARSPITITLLGTDVDGDSLVFELVTHTLTNGNFTFNLPNVTYTPAPGFYGTTMFQYFVRDAESISNTGVVTITVAEVPYVKLDYVGNGKADMSVWSPGPATPWYIQPEGVTPRYWGYANTIPVPGNYDGDSDADVAVYDPLNYKWFTMTQYPNGGVKIVGIGGPNSKVVPGDYDGDGITDFAVYDRVTSMWTIRLSGNDETRQVHFGFPGVIALSADFDGDGIDELVVYAEAAGYWYAIAIVPTLKATQWSTPFGFNGAKPVPADYDGDGKANLAVYHESAGMWYIHNSGDSFWSIPFGGAGAIAVPADYDGDGSEEVAVYHTGTFKWYARKLDGTLVIWDAGWGYPGAVPVSSEAGLHLIRE